MKVKRFSIIDYGIGNFGSLKGIINKLGHNVNTSKNYRDLEKADFLILPGVGAFPNAINLIKKNNLIKILKNLKNKKKPMIGICLGMHILTNSSDELGFNKGLSFVPGKTRQNKGKTHHIGWNKINFINKKNDFYKFHNTEFYFQHMYSYNGPKKNQLAYVNVKKNKVASIIQNKNIVGVQFHPEKSQDNGIEFFKKYIEVFK